jgi:hypothetical protein
LNLGFGIMKDRTIKQVQCRGVLVRGGG